METKLIGTSNPIVKLPESPENSNSNSDKMSTTNLALIICFVGSFGIFFKNGRGF